MNKPLHIVIVGGGTAGWMTANLMAKRWTEENIQIQLIESPDIGTVGVGEGSTPTLKRFFNDMDIDESTWMQACNATYKTNIRFVDWSPASGINSYSHPFTSQVDLHSEPAFYRNCFTRRLGLDVHTQPDSFFLNSLLAAEHKQPVAPANFPFVVEYGYHFDSGLLGQFLREHALRLGVEHIQAKIVDVQKHPDGSISAVATDKAQLIEGDFFVDCSGFRSLLLQQALGVKFNSFADNLYNDRALVLATEPLKKLPVETKATALSAGWVWHIPLQNRTGNGYVYSSAFIDDTKAEQEFREHLGLGEQDANLRTLHMKVGQVQQHWHKNCLALGLSQGFIEPLEATALHLVQTSAEIFIDEFTRGHFTDQYQKQYNELIGTRFERVRDYIVAHYKLNTRNDSEYWRSNRDNMKLSESLILLLDVWYRKGDLGQEIARQKLDTHFANPSWHCLLAGYGAFPVLSAQQAPNVDQYEDKKLAAFFAGCALNFKAK